MAEGTKKKYITGIRAQWFSDMTNGGIFNFLVHLVVTFLCFTSFQIFQSGRAPRDACTW